ncbi:MAG TPA: ABC transporter substrate-binding protein [Arachnia sp.]|nr:ABC transporter substrate-binding protein [Arachnia sp.]HMT87693.1 ABC transporter substrate-binding protein [Arachnia sp.]
MKTTRITRLTSVLITALVGALALVGCSSAAEPGETAGAPATGAASELQTITPGVLTVGVPTFPPFIGLENGTITGPDGEILYALAEALDLTVEPVPYEFAALIPALQQNRIDVALGSMFRTEERDKVINFSDPLYLEPGSLISKAPVESVDELIGKRVGTVEGYNWVSDVQAILGDQELKLFPSSSELKQDLEAGRLDVGIDSYGTSLYLYKDSEFTVTALPKDERIQAAITPGQTALLFNEDNTSLRDAFNEQIAVLHADTTVIQDALEAAGLDPAAAEVGEPYYL